MKRESKNLSDWSRNEFGDIFCKVKKYEDSVKKSKENLIQTPNESNRADLHEVNANYIRFVMVEDSIMKQTTQMHWFKKGGSNSMYFHSLIRGEGGSWLFTKFTVRMWIVYKVIKILQRQPVTTFSRYLQGKTRSSMKIQ